MRSCSPRARPALPRQGIGLSITELQDDAEKLTPGGVIPEGEEVHPCRSRSPIDGQGDAERLSEVRSRVSTRKDGEEPNCAQDPTYSDQGCAPIEHARFLVRE